MRLYMCQRSSSSVGTNVTYPSPQAFFMLLLQILITTYNQLCLNQRIEQQLFHYLISQPIQLFPASKADNLNLTWNNVYFACDNIHMIIKGRFEILKGYQNNHVTIGFGSYGQVKLAKDLQTANVVAIKVINKIAKNEVTMHNGLSHPKIIKLIDVHIDTEREITYMVLEYADGGTLFEKIKTEILPKHVIRRYFKDVCEALHYLHNQQIMHRDIKPENILLTKSGGAKLCDFGFAAILGERKTLCGTYQYMSPEMIQNRPYDYKIDIWALGILFFEMIAGHAPFRGDKPEEVLEQMKTKIYFCERFQEEDICLIKMILRVTPNKRPTIDQILEQPILKQMEGIVSQKEMQLRSNETNQSKNKSSSLQFLSESCNPKKMIEIQKTLQRQHQKQTYPPLYVPKAHHKFGVGITVPQEQTDNKSHSPMHQNRTFNTTMYNMNSQYMPFNSKPISQPSSTVNSSFSSINSTLKPGNQFDPKGNLPPMSFIPNNLNKNTMRFS